MLIPALHRLARTTRVGSSFPSKTLATAATLLIAASSTTAAFAVTPTTLSLSASAAAVPAGSVVTLTATVSGNAFPGTVGFCDLTLTPHCLTSDLFAIKQLSAAGTASVKFVPAIGSHTYRATFTGTTKFGASFNGTPIPVTVVGSLPTTTTVTKNGSALTATVTANGTTATSISGTVAFHDQTVSTDLATAALGASTFGQAFTPAAAAALNFTPTAVATADFNNDGYKDLVAIDATHLAFLQGSATGAFTFVGENSSLTGLNHPLVLDYNSDGNDDLAVSTSAGEYVFLGTGTYGFTGPVITPGAIAWGMADFNYDGIPDLIGPSDATATSLQIWIGNNSGAFTAGSGAKLPGAITDLVVDDFNGDLFLDFAAVGGSSVSVYDADGKGNFTAGPTTSVGASATKIVAVDMNNDKLQDIAVLSGSSLTLALGQPASGYTLDHPFATGSFSVTTSLRGSDGTSVAFGDLNNDGFPDFAVSEGSNGVELFYGNGSGAVASTATAASAGATASLLTDLNGDGFADIISAGTSAVTGILNVYTATASTPATNVQPAGTGTDQVVANYEGDATFSGSTSPAISVTQTPGLVTGTVTSPGVIQGTATAHLVATFTVPSSGAAPAGPVTFTVGNGSAAVIPILFPLNSPQGLKQYQAAVDYPSSSLTVGTYTITAVLAKDSNYPQTTVTGTLTVGAPAPPVTFNIPTQTIPAGSTSAVISFSATWTSQFTPGNTAGANIDGNPALGNNAACSLTSANSASCTVTIGGSALATLPPGNHAIDVYILSGDPHYASQNGTGTLVVRNIP